MVISGVAEKNGAKALKHSSWKYNLVKLLKTVWHNLIELTAQYFISQRYYFYIYVLKYHLGDLYEDVHCNILSFFYFYFF